METLGKLVTKRKGRNVSRTPCITCKLTIIVNTSTNGTRPFCLHLNLLFYSRGPSPNVTGHPVRIYTQSPFYCKDYKSLILRVPNGAVSRELRRPFPLTHDFLPVNEKSPVVSLIGGNELWTMHRGIVVRDVEALARCEWGWDMITSSITAQCCPLHIIHNVTYTPWVKFTRPTAESKFRRCRTRAIYAIPRREIAMADNARVA